MQVERQLPRGWRIGDEMDKGHPFLENPSRTRRAAEAFKVLSLRTNVDVVA